MSCLNSSPALTKHGSDQSPVVTALSMPAWPQFADREVRPVEGAGPGVLAGEGDRGDALVLEGLDGREELGPRRRRRRDAGVREGLGVVPEADEAEVERACRSSCRRPRTCRGRPALIVSFQDAMSAVMSLTRPASTCWRRPPPPHVWNRSGTSPCWSSVVSLVLNASFSLTWMSIVTFGWAAVYSSASAFHRLRPGIVVLDVIPGDRDGLGGLGRHRCSGRSLAAVDGAVDGACRGAAARAGGHRPGPRFTRIPTDRRRVTTTRSPPPEPSSGYVRALVRAVVDCATTRRVMALTELPRVRKFRTPSSRFRSTTTDVRDGRQDLLPHCASMRLACRDSVGRQIRSAETFDATSSLHCRHRRRDPRSAHDESRRSTIAVIAREAGRVRPDRLEGDQRPADVAPATRRRVEAAIREHGYQRTPRSAAPRAAAGADLPRARERVGARDRARRRAGRRAPPARRRPDRDAGPAARPGRGWIEGALARRPMGVIAVFSDLSETMREQLRARGHPVRRRRPGRRAAPRHAVDRRDELERRADRDAAPARPRPPPDRRHRRARGRPVQPRARRRLPGRDGRGRRAASTRASSATARSRSTRASPRADALLAAPRPPDGDHHRQRPPGARASTRPPARRGSTSPRTSASSASTTCRSPAGSARR